MDDFQVPLKAKDATVSLSVNPAFRDAAPILKTAWIMGDAQCIVTAGRDTSGHSEHSAHYQGNALDLRISNLELNAEAIEDFASNLSKALVDCLGPYWFVVLEPDPAGPHIHLEYAPPGKMPNIKNFVPGKFFYIKGSA